MKKWGATTSGLRSGAGGWFRSSAFSGEGHYVRAASYEAGEIPADDPFGAWASDS